MARRRIGRNDPCPCGSGKKYKQCCGQSDGLQPANLAHPQMSIETAMQAAVDHHQAGRLTHAEAIYRQILQAAPRHPDALNVRFHLALALQAQGRFGEAAEQYREALRVNPDFAEAHLNLGGVLKVQGMLDAAIACYWQALARKPEFAEAHGNLGNALYAQGKVDAAIERYHKALSIKPNYADAHLNLAHALYAQDRLREAAQHYQMAISIDPKDVDAHVGLASALLSEGQAARALEVSTRALQIRETAEAKALIVRCINGLDYIADNVEIRELVIRAMSEPWGRPGQLVAASVTLIGSNRDIRACIERATAAWPARLSMQELLVASELASVCDDRLLRCLLENAPVFGIGLERFLTMARFAILHDSAATAVVEERSEALLTLCCALAKQCFINEYVFSTTADEFRMATALRDKLAAALESKIPIPALWVAVVASYFPLFSLPSSEGLLEQSWPEALRLLLAQQLIEPLKEHHSRAAIPRLTAIDDEVSRLVRQQYEQNPYPRWVKAQPRGSAMTVDAFLLREFSLDSCHFLGKHDEVDILIAGCGTGQQSIHTAQRFSSAKVLAVDLSLTSLCYAKRKTEEVGIKNIEYAQADILRLGSIGRTFDVIECVGVLHHLAKPLTGWRELLSLLRAGGFMHLGLYSELARRDIAAAQGFVAAQGYDSSAEGIRRCRQDLIAMSDRDPFKRVTAIDDFYVTSGCRDLLFHVKEHRFTLPQIRDFLLELHLKFIGFVLEPRVVRKYRDRFPDDTSKTNLDCWDLFERENPRTFIGMYDFYVQKRA